MLSTMCQYYSLHTASQLILHVKSNLLRFHNDNSYGKCTTLAQATLGWVFTPEQITCSHSTSIMMVQSRHFSKRGKIRTVPPPSQNTNLWFNLIRMRVWSPAMTAACETKKRKTQCSWGQMSPFLSQSSSSSSAQKHLVMLLMVGKHPRTHGAFKVSFWFHFNFPLNVLLMNLTVVYFAWAW